MPVSGEFNDDYKKFCYEEQAGPDYQSMSGPWDAKSYTRPYLTNDEIKEAWRMIIALLSEVKGRPQGTDVEKNQVGVDLQELELASARIREYTMVLRESSETVRTWQKNQIVVGEKKLTELKQSTGLNSSLGLDAWLSFVNESMKARAGVLGGKRKNVFKVRLNVLCKSPK